MAQKPSPEHIAVAMCVAGIAATIIAAGVVAGIAGIAVGIVAAVLGMPAGHIAAVIDAGALLHSCAGTPRSRRRGMSLLSRACLLYTSPSPRD